MKDGPVISNIAALMGDPARANIFTALMDGRALTVTELAQAANVTIQTTSGHLAKLAAAHLISGEKQGRHRYFRLSGPDVAHVLESLMGLAQRTGAVRVRTGPKDNALREARVCYDHLAGERGVALLGAIVGQGLMSAGPSPALTKSGRTFFADFGIDVDALERARRPLCRHCLDWSERRDHLGGGLGAAILSELMARKWVKRSEGRVLVFSPQGQSRFATAFGLQI